MPSPPTSAVTSVANRLKNWIASVAVVGTACTAFALTPFYRVQLERPYGWDGFSCTGMQFLVVAACLYSALLGLYYLLEAAPGISKSLRFWRMAGRLIRAPATVIGQPLPTEDRLAVLATILKSFFGPFMLLATFQSFMNSLANARILLAVSDWNVDFIEIFNRYVFWCTMQTLIFVDVAVFTAGYLVESRRLNNEIRSVDPTLLGWAAALLCYFPFSTYLTVFVLGRQVSDFPQFDDPTAHIALNVALLLLMAVYSSASVALGLKGSNLTHRGVVTRWPYSVIRHPAYTCKNMAWWIGGIPMVSAAFAESLFAGISAVASIVGWTLLYILRAVTEEDHLRSVDEEYDAYARRVRYRFIPGVY